MCCTAVSVTQVRTIWQASKKKQQQPNKLDLGFLDFRIFKSLKLKYPEVMRSCVALFLPHRTQR